MAPRVADASWPCVPPPRGARRRGRPEHDRRGRRVPCPRALRHELTVRPTRCPKLRAVPRPCARPSHQAAHEAALGYADGGAALGAAAALPAGADLEPAASAHVWFDRAQPDAHQRGARRPLPRAPAPRTALDIGRRRGLRPEHARSRRDRRDRASRPAHGGLPPTRGAPEPPQAVCGSRHEGQEEY